VSEISQLARATVDLALGTKQQHPNSPAVSAATRPPPSGQLQFFIKKAQSVTSITVLIINLWLLAIQEHYPSYLRVRFKRHSLGLEGFWRRLNFLLELMPGGQDVEEGDSRTGGRLWCWSSPV